MRKNRFGYILLFPLLLVLSSGLSLTAQQAELYQEFLQELEQLPAEDRTPEEWKSLAMGLVEDLMNLEMLLMNQKILNQNQKVLNESLNLSYSEVKTEFENFSQAVNDEMVIRTMIEIGLGVVGVIGWVHSWE